MKIFKRVEICTTTSFIGYCGRILVITAIKLSQKMNIDKSIQIPVSIDEFQGFCVKMGQKHENSCFLLQNGLILRNDAEIIRTISFHTMYYKSTIVFDQ